MSCCIAGDAYMVAAGHDEDPAKAKKGTPIERVVEMAKAMIDVVQNLTTPRGEKVQIRVVSETSTQPEWNPAAFRQCFFVTTHFLIVTYPHSLPLHTIQQGFIICCHDT
jgi:hypothetical protein